MQGSGGEWSSKITVSADGERGSIRTLNWTRRLYATRREQEWITPPSFDVQTMSLTRMLVTSSEVAAKSGGK